MSSKNNNSELEKQRFANLLRYTSPISIGILLYVVLRPLEGDPLMMAGIAPLVIIEIIMAVKADTIAELFFKNQD
jgi:hypothetical protein